MRIWIAAAAASLASLAPQALAAQPPQLSTAGWTQTWSDEFDNPSTDMAPLAATIGNPDGPPELETYTNSPQNLYIGPAADPDSSTGSVGALHIATIFDGQSTYSSALVSTRNSFSQTYGLFEVRAKLPQGAGLWPAIWMLPTDPPGQSTPADGKWPYSGEIDIMESGANGDSNVVQGTLHSGPASSQTQPSAVFHPSGDQLPFTTADWHTYAMEWEPGSISFFVDDDIYETLTANSVTRYVNGVATVTDEPGWALPPTSAAGGDPNAPFDQPFHLIFNVAVGGYAGTPDLTPNVPYEMDIDYARAYSLAQTPEPAALGLIAFTGLSLLHRRRRAIRL